MKFQRLRLAGFKSFVDPTELRIEDGLTGVVGPNGCGKSNLLEALRWLMGESSPKSMRGGGMEDVIFAGTSSRPGRDFADVTLLLDNSDRRAPAQFNDEAQIEVIRRIERGLGSAYRINGRDVRQRDVQLLFADAATGAHSPALVSQGRIGAIIAAKPAERRAMLEEAAGISGLHVRRKDAEQRLRAAEANLTRLDDVLAGMEAQVASLKRQARQAERYRGLSDRIRAAEAALLFARWRGAQAAADVATRVAAEAERKTAETTRLVAAASAAQADKAARLPELRQAEAEAAARLQALGQARAALKGEAEAVERRARELSAARETARRDLAREASLGEDARAASERLAAERNALVARTSDSKALLQQAAGSVEMAEAVATADERALGERIERQAEAQAARRAAEAALGTAETRGRRIGEERARLEREHAALDTGDGSAARRAAAETELASADAAIARAVARIETAEAARRNAEAAREAASGELLAARGVLGALTSERDALARLVAAPAKGPEGASALDSIRVAPGYEAALAAALGDDLSARIGRSGTGRSWGGATAAGDPALPGGAEPLAAHVDAPPELARRLAQVGVAPADAAPALAGSLAVGQRLVSRDGRLWRWDGFQAHGGQAVAAAERLVQRNRLAEIVAQVPDAEQALATAEGAAAEARAAVDRVAADDRTARTDRAAAERAADLARRALASAMAEAERRAGQAEALQAALERARDEAASAEADLAAARQAVAAVPDVEAAVGATTAARQVVEASRAALAGARADQAGLVRGIEADASRLAAIDAERTRWDERLAGSAAQAAELEARAAAIDGELTELAERPATLAAREAKIADDLHGAEITRRAAADALAAAESELRGFDAALRQANEALGEAREARAGAAATAEHHDSRRAELAQLAGERFQMPPPLLPERLGFDAEALGDEPALAADFERLTLERERIGPVNLRAETELAEIEETLGTSTAERDELTTAIARLRGSIGALNREGRVRLLAAFEAVDKHFRDLFGTLFGGGAAHLELIESDDPLEAGLEIMAQPPGKKLGSLTLMSGGEQALTAIALIFAVFLTNPAPICVLDEVDAPLDDANVERFCDLLDRMAEMTGTRFLIVTHNAVTMSRVHRLFGVTMAEKGVSQLVSVDLARAEAMVAA